MKESSGRREVDKTDDIRKNRMKFFKKRNRVKCEK